jgi:gluconokinase
MSSQQPPPTPEDNQQQTGPRWIWFITGPTACGKTTIAKALADKLGFIFVEGDDVRAPPLHPSSPDPPHSLI